MFAFINSQHRLGGVIAHRGSIHKAPENTLSGFEQALQEGARTIELDVSESLDNRDVVMHDDTLDRTTNGSGLVAETPWAEIAQLDAGSWFSSKFAGEKVPHLSQVLDWSKDKAHLDIEVKTSAATPEYAAKLLALIEEKGMQQQVSVTSFDNEFLEELERLQPKIETGVLLHAGKTIKGAGIGAVAGLVAGAAAGFATTGSIFGGIAAGALGLVTGAVVGREVGIRPSRRLARESKADHLLPHWTMTDPLIIGQAHEQGKRVIPWTVNNDAVATVMKRWNVDGVISDRPGTVIHHFEHLHQAQ